MTDTNLDRAAKMAGYDDWRDAQGMASSTAIRSISAHAATLNELDAAKAELEAFKREVSEVCRHLPNRPFVLDRFILPKPDPLVEVIAEVKPWDTSHQWNNEAFSARLRAALAKHGLKLERIDQ